MTSRHKAMLSREKLMKGGFLPFETVYVPELGGEVGVQGLTAGEVIAYQKAIENDDPITQGVKLVVRCVVDDKRRRIFSDDDWKLLMEGPNAWPMSALNSVAFVAMKLNQGSAEGNSKETPEEGSSSGSRSPSAKRSKS